MTDNMAKLRSESITNRSSRFRRFTSQMTATTGRCHAMGGSICTLLIGLTISVWANPEIMMSDTADNKGGLADAILLLDHADSWRQKYITYVDESESLKRRADMIATWLPASVDWERLDEGVRESAAIFNVEIVSLRKNESHVGSRVGVVVAECQVKGNFHSICQWMRQLSATGAEASSDVSATSPPISNVSSSASPHPQHNVQSRSPVWCHRIRMMRLPLPDANETQCAATLMIRVPYAAKGSAAANIVSKEPTDA